MWYILVLVLVCAAVIVFFLLKRPKRPPVDVYVCTECGKKDCTCHMQEPS
jgi:hypothetical protein